MTKAERLKKATSFDAFISAGTLTEKLSPKETCVVLNKAKWQGRSNWTHDAEYEEFVSGSKCIDENYGIFVAKVLKADADVA